jgi:hypothetical protein
MLWSIQVPQLCTLLPAGGGVAYQTQLHTVYAAGRAVFAAADLDGDGFLDPQEMTEVLQQLGRPISTADVEQIMR